MFRTIQILICILLAGHLNAQELNCTITVNADKIPGSNKQVFSTLETALNEFVNQKWSYNYKILSAH